MTLSTLIAIPNFWFAMLLTIVFSVTFRLLPAGGFPGWDAGILPAFKSLLLPTIALALPQAAIAPECESKFGR